MFHFGFGLFSDLPNSDHQYSHFSTDPQHIGFYFLALARCFPAPLAVFLFAQIYGHLSPPDYSYLILLRSLANTENLLGYSNPGHIKISSDKKYKKLVVGQRMGDGDER